MQWRHKINADADYWRDYRSYLERLSEDTFPDCDQLNSLLQGNVQTAGAAAVRFICSTDHAQGDYENRIYTSGQVSTRPGSWHDLFNALVWLRFPRIKSALNALHFQAQSGPNGRSRLRDALTLFDECGVMLVSNRRDLLTTVAQRDWHNTFQLQANSWRSDMTLATFGHAMLEKYLAPYKSMTANALLIQVDANISLIPRDKLLTMLDSALAEKMLNQEVLKHPRSLTPIPLTGVPGWVFTEPQTDEFYADPSVFRPAPDNFVAASILHLELRE